MGVLVSVLKTCDEIQTNNIIEYTRLILCLARIGWVIIVIPDCRRSVR